MCLLRDDEATNLMKKNYGPEEVVTRWKVVRYADNKYFVSNSYTYIWKAGINKAEFSKYGEIMEIQSPNKVYNGIHVFVHQYNAEEYLKWNNELYLLKVKCKIKDLIAAGIHDIDGDIQEVYSEVFVEALPDGIMA